MSDRADGSAEILLDWMTATERDLLRLVSDLAGALYVAAQERRALTEALEEAQAQLRARSGEE